MNGRVYDPMLKRFLAPDSQIFDPYDSRAYDRFAYVANNPMMMLDPSGEELFLVIVIALAASYVITGLYDLIETDKWEWNPFKRTLPFGLNVNADLDRIHDSSQGGLNPSGSGSGGLSESGNFTITADNLPTHVPANLTFLNQQTVETESPPSGPCDWLNSPENCQGLEGTSFSVANTTYNGGSGHTNSESSNASEAADGEDDTEITPSYDCPVGDASCEEIKENPCGDGFVQGINGNCYEIPCPGDPVPNPEITPQTNSGILGGMFGCTRNGNGCLGETLKKYHGGIDLKADYGDPVFATHDGVISLYAQFDDEIPTKIVGAGYYSKLIFEENGIEKQVLYFHLQEGNRTFGEVNQGDIIGYLGDSGNLSIAVTQNLAISHLHIKTKENGITVNPSSNIKTEFNELTGEIISTCD